jgi:hypothetical protein
MEFTPVIKNWIGARRSSLQLASDILLMAKVNESEEDLREAMELMKFIGTPVPILSKHLDKTNP